MSKELRADHDEIKRALAVLFEPGQVVELRALGVKHQYRGPRTVAGYFDDHEALAAAAMEVSPSAKGVYVTLNEIDSALLARRKNHAAAVEAGEPTTGDTSITHRRWMLVDLDPKRPAGISSSDAEHGASLALALRISETLSGRGWPEPVFADSGNGAHLLYRIAAPPDDDGLVTNCLRALAIEFDSGTVSIDTKVGNAARITKLYGTMARKGEDVPDWPHRLSRILSVPDQLLVVPESVLRVLAAGAAGQARRSSSMHPSRPLGHHLDLARWISEFGVEVDGPRDWESGRKWIFRTCPWNAEHTNKSAWIAQLASGAISAGCQHASCDGHGWADLRRLFERGGDDGGLGDSDRPREPRGGPPKRSQASTLIALAEASGASFWHTAGGEAYATIVNQGHRETIPLRGKAAILWLRHLYYRDSGDAPGARGVTDALEGLRARAVFDGEQHEVHVRVGEYAGDIFLDLGSPDWTAVRISVRGWEVVADAPIKFHRPKGMLALPDPQRGGALDLLRPFLNVADDDDFRLVVTAAIAMLFPKGPYPVVILGGEQGSAKSTSARVLRELIDPNRAPLRSQPRDEHDLVIAATNGWLLNFDNLSGMAVWLSDAICRLATGGGFATRELYSDTDEVLFDVQRPVIVNGIDEIATRGDLLDRSLLINQPTIPDEDRRAEEEFWAEFAQVRPRILGALLDAVVVSMREVGALRLARLPRLADFARRGAAAASALGWTAGDFLGTYEANRASGHASIIEDSLVARVLLDHTIRNPSWTGTATQLLANLIPLAGDEVVRSRAWPSTALQLANAIRRIVPNLRSAGLEVTFSRQRQRGRARLITLERHGDEVGMGASISSIPSTSDSVARTTVDDMGWTAPGSNEESSTPGESALDGLDGMDARCTHLNTDVAVKGAAGRICPACQVRPTTGDRLCFRCESERQND